MTDIKVSILEKDGVELQMKEEYTLSAFDVLPKDVIPTGDTWTINETEQLVLVNELTIQGTAQIIVSGTLGVL